VSITSTNDYFANQQQTMGKTIFSLDELMGALNEAEERIPIREWPEDGLVFLGNMLSNGLQQFAVGRRSSGSSTETLRQSSIIPGRVMGTTLNWYDTQTRRLRASLANRRK
jgi:hypothetical protein